jgi:WD40 repeat protein
MRAPLRPFQSNWPRPVVASFLVLALALDTAWIPALLGQSKDVGAPLAGARWSVTLGGEIIALAASPTADTLACVTLEPPRNGVRMAVVDVFSCANGRRLTRQTRSERINSIAYDKNGSRLAVACGALEVWDAKTLQIQDFLAPHPMEDEGFVRCAFSTDGKWVAGGSWKGEIVVFDAQTKKKVVQLKQKWTIGSLSFSADGTALLASCSDDDATVSVWGTSSWKEKWHAAEPRMLPVGLDPILGPAAFVKNGKVACGGLRLEGPIICWDAESGKETTCLDRERPHSPTVCDLCAKPNSASFATAEDSGYVAIWTLGERPTSHTWQAHKDQVRCVAFSADGRLLFSGSRDGSVKAWDVAKLPAPLEKASPD